MPFSPSRWLGGFKVPTLASGLNDDFEDVEEFDPAQPAQASSSATVDWLTGRNQPPRSIWKPPGGDVNLPAPPPPPRPPSDFGLRGAERIAPGPAAPPQPPPYDPFGLRGATEIGPPRPIQSRVPPAPLDLSDQSSRVPPRAPDPFPLQAFGEPPEGYGQREIPTTDSDYFRRLLYNRRQPGSWNPVDEFLEGERRHEESAFHIPGHDYSPAAPEGSALDALRGTIFDVDDPTAAWLRESEFMQPGIFDRPGFVRTTENLRRHIFEAPDFIMDPVRRWAEEYSRAGLEDDYWSAAMRGFVGGAAEGAAGQINPFNIATLGLPLTKAYGGGMAVRQLMRGLPVTEAFQAPGQLTRALRSGMHYGQSLASGLQVGETIPEAQQKFREGNNLEGWIDVGLASAALAGAGASLHGYTGWQDAVNAFRGRMQGPHGPIQGPGLPPGWTPGRFDDTRLPPGPGTPNRTTDPWGRPWVPPQPPEAPGPLAGPRTVLGEVLPEGPPGTELGPPLNRPVMWPEPVTDVEAWRVGEGLPPAPDPLAEAMGLLPPERGTTQMPGPIPLGPDPGWPRAGMPGAGLDTKWQGPGGFDEFPFGEPPPPPPPPGPRFPPAGPRGGPPPPQGGAPPAPAAPRGGGPPAPPAAPAAPTGAQARRQAIDTLQKQLDKTVKDLRASGMPEDSIQQIIRADLAGREQKVAEMLGEAPRIPKAIPPTLPPQAREPLGELLGGREEAPPAPGIEDVDPLTKLLQTVEEGQAAPVEHLAEDLATDVNKDQLTGLGGRRAWERAGQKPGQLFGRIDLDNFKAVNDTHGHAAGDRVLQIVAGVLQTFARRAGDAFRLGGDEFGLTIQDPGNAPARMALRDQVEGAINQALAEAGFGEAGGKKIGASLGFGLDDAQADAAAIERKAQRGISQPREDTAAAARQEQLDMAAARREELRGKGKTGDERFRQESARALEADVDKQATEMWPDVLAAARVGGYEGQTGTLRGLFDNAVLKAKEILTGLHMDSVESGPEALLRFIRDRGGIRPFDYKTIHTLKRFGTKRVKMKGDWETLIGKFQERWKGAAGPFRNEGLEFDKMLQEMEGDPRFKHYADNIELLKSDLWDIASGEAQKNWDVPSLGDTLAGPLELDVNAPWWNDPRFNPEAAAPEAFPEQIAPPAGEAIAGEPVGGMSLEDLMAEGHALDDALQGMAEGPKRDAIVARLEELIAETEKRIAAPTELTPEGAQEWADAGQRELEAEARAPAAEAPAPTGRPPAELSDATLEAELKWMEDDVIPFDQVRFAALLEEQRVRQLLDRAPESMDDQALDVVIEELDNLLTQTRDEDLDSPRDRTILEKLNALVREKNRRVGELTRGGPPEPETLEDLMVPDERVTKPAVDILETGEAQPRLPEAGGVREGEIRTPTLTEAPSGEATAVQRAARQKELIQRKAAGTITAAENRELDAMLGKKGQAGQTEMFAQPDELDFVGGEGRELEDLLAPKGPAAPSQKGLAELPEGEFGLEPPEPRQTKAEQKAAEIARNREMTRENVDLMNALQQEGADVQAIWNEHLRSGGGIEAADINAMWKRALEERRAGKQPPQRLEDVLGMTEDEHRAAYEQRQAERAAAEKPRTPGEVRVGDEVRWRSKHGQDESGTIIEVKPNGDLIARREDGVTRVIQPWMQKTIPAAMSPEGRAELAGKPVAEAEGAGPTTERTAIPETPADPLADLVLRHGIEAPEKVDEIAASMRRVGWKGRPALILRDGETRTAWTATHRIEAARRAGLTYDQIPKVEVDAQALRDAGYDVADLTSKGKGKRIDALRAAGQEHAAQLLEDERAGSKAREEVHEGAADVEDVAPNVREFLVRQLGYTNEEVTALGRKGAQDVGNKVRTHPEGVKAGIAAYRKAKPERAPGEISDELANLVNEAEESRVSDVMLRAAERGREMGLTRVRKGPGETPTPKYSTAELQAAMDATEDYYATRAERTEGGEPIVPPAKPFDPAEGNRIKAEMVHNARRMAKLLEDPTPENLDEYARLLGEQAKRQAQREIKGFKQEPPQKHERTGEYLASGFGGLERLFHENPANFWWVIRTAGGGLAGAMLSDSEEEGGDWLTGALLGATAAGAGLSPKLWKAMRTKAPDVARALKELVPPREAFTRRPTPPRRGVSPVRAPRDYGKDLGFLEMGTQPHYAVPDAWAKISPALAELDAAERQQPSTTPRMIEFTRRMYLKEPIAELRKLAQDSKDQGHYRRGRYIEAMVDELLDTPTLLERGLSDLSGGHVTPKQVGSFFNGVEKTVYLQLLGFALDTGVINRTQAGLAIPHIGVKGLWEGIKQSRTAAGQRATEFLDIPTPSDYAGRLVQAAKPGWIRNFVDVALSPLKAGDVKNRRQVYLGAKDYAQKRGLTAEQAHEWAMEITNQTQGVPGELGNNPFMRHLGPFRMFSKYPTIWAQMVNDIVRHPDPAVRRRGLGLMIGVPAALGLVGVNALSFMFPRVSALGPVKEAVKDVYGHAASEIGMGPLPSHTLMEDINPFSLEAKVWPRYPVKVIKEIRDLYRHGAGRHPEFDRSGNLRSSHSAMAGIASLLGIETWGASKERAAEDEAFRFGAESQALRSRQTRQHKADLRAALESGDWEEAYAAMREMTPAQIREFHQRERKTPYQAMLERVPKRDRPEFERRFRERLQHLQQR